MVSAPHTGSTKNCLVIRGSMRRKLGRMSVKEKQANSAAAMQRLFREHCNVLLRRARARVSNRDDAEDVVQDSFLKLLEKGSLEDINSLSAYAATIVRNVIIANFRRSALEGRNSPRELQLANERSIDAAEIVEAREERLAIQEALNRLPERQRRIMSMYAEGLTPHEIAEREGTSPNSISCLVDRAKGFLRTELRRMGYVLVAIPRRFLDAKRRILHRGFVFRELDPSILMPIVAALIVVLATTVKGPTTAVPGRSTVESEVFRHGNEIGATSGGGDFSSQFQTESSSAGKGEGFLSAEIAGRQIEWTRSEHQNEPQPSFIGRVIDLASHPERIEPPSCGGLPICSNR